MNSEYVSATITAARETFVPTAGKPKDNGIIRMRECLRPLLIGIPYKTADGNHNLWDKISSDADYKALHHEVFNTPTRPAVYPTIPGDATYVVCYRSETVHKLL